MTSALKINTPFSTTHPRPSLFDTSQASLAKTFWIDLQRIDSTFSESKFGLNRHHQFQLSCRGRPQPATGSRASMGQLNSNNHSRQAKRCRRPASE